MKKRLSVLLVLLLFLSLFPSSDGAGLTPGEIIIFGSYEQDGNDLDNQGRGVAAKDHDYTYTNGSYSPCNAVKLSFVTYCEHFRC